MSEINTNEFMAAFDEWVEKAEKNYDATLRGVALDMFSSIVLRTPVDTGRARGNWQIAIDKTPSGEVGTAESWKKRGNEGVTAPSESRSSREATNRAQLSVGQDTSGVKNYIAIVNNLPYINQLENGRSGQMPAGMVRVTLSEFERKLNKAARENQL